MTSDEPSTSPADDRGPDLSAFEIDRTVAGPSRVHNYLIGGNDNFAVDRELGEHLRTLSPAELDAIRALVRSISFFVLRAVRYLVREAGIRQFLCTVTPVPTENNLHEVAQQIAPESRVVYISREPVVMAHAHILRKSTPEGASDYIHGHLNDLSQILQQAAETLDFTQPVGVVLPTMSRVSDKDDPYGIVARLLEAVPSGSYLVVGHMTSDIAKEWVTKGAKFMSEALGEPWTLRTYAEVSRFFDGLELVEDGVVHIDQWRRHENQPIPNAEKLIPAYGGVGRKP